MNVNILNIKIRQLFEGPKSFWKKKLNLKVNYEN